MAVISAEGVHYLHADHLNTPKVVTDPQGAVVWQADYQPFGDVTELVDALELNLRFPGRYHDRETGLLQNWHREYVPELGRYSQSDPIGLGGGLNTFVYAADNPTRLFDFFGLAYFAKRPLTGLPWLGAASHQRGSVDDRLNTEISHEHLFFEDGKSPPNIGLGPNGLFTETDPQGYRVTDTGYDDCQMRIAISRAPTGKYCLLGLTGQKNNCQDWAQSVRTIYHRIENDPVVRARCKECD